MAADEPATPQVRTGKTRLVSMADLDRRTKSAQTAVATKSAIMSDLGGESRLSTLERLQCENVAMSSAVLRDMQVRWLQGEEVSVTEMVSVENVINRTAAALGTARRVQDITPDLGQYLAVKANKEAESDE